jgi:hypothetical protein
MKLSVAWGLTILSAAFYARPLYNFLLTFLPRVYIVFIVGGILLGCLVGLIKRALSRNWGISKYLELSVAFAGLGALFYVLDLPEEKIHILLFGFLGVLRIIEDPKRNLFKAVLFVISFSLLSEGLQALLPSRVADTRDIAVDSASGFLGAYLCRLFFYNYENMRSGN